MNLRRSFTATIVQLLFALCLLAACSRSADDREPSASGGGPLRLAVAANFATPAQRLAAAFSKKTGARVEVSTGSSGKLFAQIENGAPFHVLLSADVERPRRLEERGLAVEGSRFCYALGRLVLYGPGVASPGDGRRDLAGGQFEHLSIANPATAPYGAAAKQVLDKLGVWQDLSPRIARGENITQAHQFVESGGAELGLVALSSVIGRSKHRYWIVPRELYDPIRQDAVLLERGANDARARAFLTFLRSARARAVIEAAGYKAECGQ